MLEGILKGLLQWLYGLLLEIVEYIADGLLGVFSMDLAYFQAVAPVTGDIINILIACGWALLLGNLVFQAAKTMASGLGFEGEDPRTLFARTFVFGFLLLASRQVCEIGLGLAGTIIDLLGVPDSVQISLPGENIFSIGASWLLVIIIGLVLMWQLVKLFFEIGERYFIVAFLTMMAPLAFATGGSKNTADIFKGWARMYGSMCLMMTLNVVFLKLLLSAMGNMPDGAGVLPWMVLVVAIARAARKADDLIMRVGLNPAMTGGGLGMRLPGVLSAMVLRTVTSSVVKAASANGAGKTKAAGSGQAPAPGSPSARSGKIGNVHMGTASHTAASIQNNASPYSTTGNDTAEPTGIAGMGTAGTESGNSNHTASRKSSFMQAVRGSIAPPGMFGSRGRVPDTTQNSIGNTPQISQSGRPSALTPPGINGTAGIKPQNPSGTTTPSTRPGIPPSLRGVGRNAEIPGTAGRSQQSTADSDTKQSRFTDTPPGLRGAGHSAEAPATAGRNTREPTSAAPPQMRYTSVPPGLRSTGRNAETPGTAGTNRHTQSGSTESSSRNNASAFATQFDTASSATRQASPSEKTPPGIREASGTAGKAARRTAMPSLDRGTDKLGTVVSATSTQRPTQPSAKPTQSLPTPSTPVTSSNPPAPPETRTSRPVRASGESPRPAGTSGIRTPELRSFGDTSPPGQRALELRPPGVRGNAGQTPASPNPAPGRGSQPKPPGNNSRTRRPKP